MDSVETLIGQTMGTLIQILYRFGLILFPGAVVVALLMFQRVSEDVRSKLGVLLLFFPGIWLFVVMWGVLFAVNPRGTTVNPAWVSALSSLHLGFCCYRPSYSRSFNGAHVCSHCLIPL